MGLIETVVPPGLVVGVVLSVLLIRRIDGPDGRWGVRLRSRLVMGVPWGTLVVVGLVLSVYLFVQNGIDHWYDPIVVPFRAWSYLYPEGILMAPFSHDGAGHVVGNLVGTLAVAPVAEYAWGHFPRDRGSSSFASWRTNPWVRALVVVPAVAIGVGVLTGLFSWGPVIGFSGVVFAFAGFAILTRPIAALIGVLGVGRFLDVAYNAMRNPIVTANPRPSGPSPPWWAGIAIQGHALGLLLGVVLGAMVVRRRGETRTAMRVWLAVLFFAVAKGLWAVYWFRGNSTYVLYRGLGMILVLGLAVVVTATVSASDRPLPALSGEWAVPSRSATAVIVIVVAAMAGVAIPTNFVTVSEEATPPDETSVSVRGYDVTYDENVKNRLVSVFNVSAFGETTAVRTSGVIVVNPDRHIWAQQISKGQLAFRGRTRVEVGGFGWKERITAVRQGWSAVGGGATYHVWLEPPGEERKLVYTADPAGASPVVGGRNVTVSANASTEAFELVVSRRNRTLGTAAIPTENRTTAAGGIQFVRKNRQVLATANGTRVKVAQREKYRTVEE